MLYKLYTKYVHFYCLIFLFLLYNCLNIKGRLKVEMIHVRKNILARTSLFRRETWMLFVRYLRIHYLNYPCYHGLNYFKVYYANYIIRLASLFLLTGLVATVV